ncbi:MAG: ferridoxin [bacterium]|nr:ferridoxin [bacterium]
MTDLFEIDEESCNSCGLCVEICTGNFVLMEEGGVPRQSDDAEVSCVRCGHCMTVCLKGSFSLRDIPIEQCPPVQKELMLTPEHCEHFLRYRRTIRHFRDKTVSKAVLTQLIEMARYAPSGFNCQCVEWLVLGGGEGLRKYGEITVDFMRWMLEHMPEIAKEIHFDKDVELWEGGSDVVFQDAPIVILAHAPESNQTARESSIIALTYLDLAATSLGLGSCWAGLFEKAVEYFPPMKQEISLPEGHKLFGAMMVGYPRYKHHWLAARNEPKITWRI